MKKIFTFLIFAFLSNTLLIGQCSDLATPNANHKFFNLDYFLEADRDAALEGLESITFPAGAACDCGETVTILVDSLNIQGPVGANERYRIRGAGETTDYFGGENGNFMGDIIFNYADETSETCSYGTTSNPIGPCSDFATPNSTGKFFNLDYNLEADRDAALEGLESITFPAGTGCDCGETVTILVDSLNIQGPVGENERYRIRASGEPTDYFGGENGNFMGDIIFNYAEGNSETCSYGTTSTPMGQCSDFANPNANYRFFNLDYNLEADRDAALEGLESITFPAGVACECGETVTIAVDSLIISGPVGANERYRIRGAADPTDYFGGENGNFMGDIIFNYADGSSKTCSYGTTSTSNIDGFTPISIFPNPVKDQLTLIDVKGKVTIYNTFGQAIKQLTIDNNHATIQLAGLLNGQYFLRVLKEDGTIVTKQFSKMN